MDCSARHYGDATGCPGNIGGESEEEVPVKVGLESETMNSIDLISDLKILSRNTED